VKYESVLGCRLPKIGLGTWKIGGGSRADRGGDSESLSILRSALDLGYCHFDTAEMYGAGHCEELLGEAIRDSRRNREDLFITTKVKPPRLDYEGVIKSCEGSLRRLRMEYVDLCLVHWPSAGMKLADSLRALNYLVRDGSVRHLGVSNFDVKLLKQSMTMSQAPILTNQVPYSVADRSCVSNGVLEYCQAHGILVTAYSPLEQGAFRAGTALTAIAKARSATVAQIALAWLCAQPCVITIPMSSRTQHLRDNLEAADISLSAEDMAAIG
jgi:diketogulonate reductase-like aldo/keto reductase